MSTRDSLRDDLHATIAARRDLGPSYEAELVDSFVERVDARIDQRLQEASRRPAPSGPGSALAITSLALGVPLSAIAGSLGHLAGLVVAWAGIVGVNAAQALARRGAERRR